MILFLAASLFMADPAPLDMPRAESYIVKEGDAYRLEDRYNRLDLWTSRAVIGCWCDDAGRTFTLARLSVTPPMVNDESFQTRSSYTAGCVAMPKARRFGREIPKEIKRSLELLSPCQLMERGRSPRQLPRGYADVDYWQEPTNSSTIVCSFLREKGKSWYMAVWELADGDNIYEKMGVFEDCFLAKEFLQLKESNDIDPSLGEREQLRLDAHHSVAAYPSWHVTDSKEFVVLDHIGARSSFVSVLTNELPVMRAKYAEVLPTPIDGSNALCVARIYADRNEYLDAIGDDMQWTAAYWCPWRRELVAYLPDGGEVELLRTFRHEAFHQYLSYATSMISVSPWLNEGYAQYFEDMDKHEWDEMLSLEDIDRLAKLIPNLLSMNYEQFYDGSDQERRLKYRLSWSIARFIEHGAPKVRFQPFKDLKSKYIETLLRSQDMQKATSAAFCSKDRLVLFISEWKKFWKK